MMPMPMDGGGSGPGGPMPQGSGSHGWAHNRFGPRPWQMFLAPFWGGYLFQFVLVFFISFILRINQRLSNIQSEKLQTEVSYLKAQINPHFLFNTLNSLYALALDKSDAAPEALLKLSSIMRYVVTESSRDSVPLESEINYIKNYISLQQLRMDDSAQLSFSVSGSTAGRSISPMLLIPFIENAFKYGVNPEENSAISISIVIEEEQLSLKVKNNIVNLVLPEEEKSEKGMENTQMRLEYQYPQKHKLLIFDTPDTYEVQLTLNLA
jgi:LytS/YehU family sensor histidine kinase